MVHGHEPAARLLGCDHAHLSPHGADELASQARTNWHQWRGPLSTGVAPEANPPVEWDESKNIKWKVPIEGESTAILSSACEVTTGGIEPEIQSRVLLRCVGGDELT